MIQVTLYKMSKTFAEVLLATCTYHSAVVERLQRSYVDHTHSSTMLKPVDDH